MALIVIVTLFWWAALHFFLAARTVRAELGAKAA